MVRSLLLEHLENCLFSLIMDKRDDFSPNNLGILMLQYTNPLHAGGEFLRWSCTSFEKDLEHTGTKKSS